MLLAVVPIEADALQPAKGNNIIIIVIMNIFFIKNSFLSGLYFIIPDSIIKMATSYS